VTEFPKNFGVGRPAMQSQAQYYVAAAREYEAAGQRDEADRWWLAGPAVLVASGEVLD